MLTEPRAPSHRYAWTLASASAVVLLLSGCSAFTLLGPGDNETVTFEASNLPDPDDVVLPDADDGGEQAEPEIEPDFETGDHDQTVAYCEPAELGYAALGDFLDANHAKSLETGKDDNLGDVRVMNNAGEEMLAGIDQVELHWSQAQAALDGADFPATATSVSGEDLSAAFDQYFDYFDNFARPEAHVAAQANTMEEYGVGFANIQGVGGAIETLVSGAEALNTIVEFNVEHCGTERPPGM